MGTGWGEIGEREYEVQTTSYKSQESKVQHREYSFIIFYNFVLCKIYEKTKFICYIPETVFQEKKNEQGAL